MAAGEYTVEVMAGGLEKFVDRYLPGSAPEAGKGWLRGNTKRRQEIFTPLQQDIGKALEAFAKARGITVIVDGSQVPVVYAADSIDITRAFINDFNSKNPATASVPQP